MSRGCVAAGAAGLLGLCVECAYCALFVWEISQAADWALTDEALKAASVDLVNFAIHLPVSHLYGLGDTCSADGMRFYVPVDILAADFSHLLHGRGVTLYAHTGENAMRLHQPQDRVTSRLTPPHRSPRPMAWRCHSMRSLDDAW